MACLLKEMHHAMEDANKVVHLFSDFLVKESFINLVEVSCEIQMSEKQQRR